MSAPETVVVIRAFNEERHLEPLFDRLAEQRYRDFETVVVDSGSTDLTPAIAERRADRLLRIDAHDFTFGYSLNAGIRSSEARYAAIISAHALPTDPEWLGRLVASLAGDRVAMVYGRQTGVATSKYGEQRDFERTFGPRPEHMRPHRFFANNANSALRRDLWAQQPFDEHLPGLEDAAWAKHWIERGYEVLYEPQACVYHIHDESWRQVRRRYHREAVALRRIGIRGPRHVLPDALRELTSTVADLAHAAANGHLAARAGEIVRFRWHKAAGHLGGLLDGADFAQPSVREAAYFDRYQHALVVHGPGRAHLDEVPLPEVKPADVLVKVAYAGICATDLEIVDGALGYYATGMAQYPIVPGHEFSGRVAAVGANAGEWRVGDPVVVECIQGCGRCEPCRRSNAIACGERAEVGVIRRDGGFAEYVVAPGRFLHRLPAATSLRVAALCEPTAVVLKGLRRLAPHLSGGPRRCAVVGAGPIGYLTAALLGSQGHQVTVFDRNPARRALFASSEHDLARLAGFDVVIEATGDAGALSEVLGRSATGATILLLGLPYARREFSFESIVAFDKTIIGSVGSAREDFAEAVRRIGELPLKPLLDCVVPFTGMTDALATARRREHLKVLVAVDPALDEARGAPAGHELATAARA